MHAVQDRLRENFSVRSFADRSKRTSRSQLFLCYRGHIIKQLGMSAVVYVYQVIQGWRFQFGWRLLLQQAIGKKLLDHEDVMDQFAQASSFASNIDIKGT